MHIRCLASIAVLATVLAAAAPVHAATKTASHSTASAPVASQVSAGSIEITPNVTFDHMSLKREGYGNVDTFTQIEFTPTIGFCFTNHFEATTGAILNHQSLNGTSATSLGATAGILYNFSPQGRMIPFAGIGFGTIFNGFTFNDTAVLAPSITVGLRALVGNAASVNMSLGYDHETDGHASMNRIKGGIGLSIFPWHMK